MLRNECEALLQALHLIGHQGRFLLHLRRSDEAFRVESETGICFEGSGSGWMLGLGLGISIGCSFE